MDTPCLPQYFKHDLANCTRGTDNSYIIFILILTWHLSSLPCLTDMNLFLKSRSPDGYVALLLYPSYTLPLASGLISDSPDGYVALLLYPSYFLRSHDYM